MSLFTHSTPWCEANLPTYHWQSRDRESCQFGLQKKYRFAVSINVGRHCSAAFLGMTFDRCDLLAAFWTQMRAFSTPQANTERTRTSDPEFRKLVLYPAELRDSLVGYNGTGSTTQNLHANVYVSFTHENRPIFFFDFIELRAIKKLGSRRSIARQGMRFPGGY